MKEMSPLGPLPEFPEGYRKQIHLYSLQWIKPTDPGVTTWEHLHLNSPGAEFWTILKISPVGNQLAIVWECHIAEGLAIEKGLIPRPENAE